MKSNKKSKVTQLSKLMNKFFIHMYLVKQIFRPFLQSYLLKQLQKNVGLNSKGYLFIIL